MQKISLFDYARISLRETTKKCEVKIGDLVKVDSAQDRRTMVIGIVSAVNDNNMCIMVGNSLEWWSRYVSCTIL